MNLNPVKIKAIENDKLQEGLLEFQAQLSGAFVQNNGLINLSQFGIVAPSFAQIVQLQAQGSQSVTSVSQLRCVEFSLVMLPGAIFAGVYVQGAHKLYQLHNTISNGATQDATDQWLFDGCLEINTHPTDNIFIVAFGQALIAGGLMSGFVNLLNYKKSPYLSRTIIPTTAE